MRTLSPEGAVCWSPGSGQGSGTTRCGRNPGWERDGAPYATQGWVRRTGTLGCNTAGLSDRIRNHAHSVAPENAPHQAMGALQGRRVGAQGETKDGAPHEVVAALGGRWEGPRHCRPQWGNRPRRGHTTSKGFIPETTISHPSCPGRGMTTSRAWPADNDHDTTPPRPAGATSPERGRGS